MFVLSVVSIDAMEMWFQLKNKRKKIKAKIIEKKDNKFDVTEIMLDEDVIRWVQ